MKQKVSLWLGNFASQEEFQEYFKWDRSEAIKANKKVEVHVKIEYVENSARPKTFRINYTIDGQTYTHRIKNISGGK